jgi:hypothetical protein
MPFRFAALAAVMAAAPAAASCPSSRADAEAGVQVTMDDDSSVVLTRAPDNMVTEDWTYADGYRSRLRAVHGVHAVEFGELDGDSGVVPGTDETTVFAELLPPEPVAGQVWSTTARLMFGTEDGGEIIYNSVARSEGTLVIGDCSYRAVTVMNRIGSGEDARIEELDFLPDLGLSILRVTSGGMGEDPTRLTPVTIAPGPP